jgi:ferritin-like metal-binding protein YciE
LLAAAQAIKHGEISRYGTVKAGAPELGLNHAVRLFAIKRLKKKRRLMRRWRRLRSRGQSASGSGLDRRVSNAFLIENYSQQDAPAQK